MRRAGTRTAAVAVAISAAASLLAGCSSGDDAGSDQAEAATTTSTAPATTSTLPAPLTDQTPPDQANGLDVDGATVWVTDFDTGTIVQVDRETGAILARVDAGSASADDVALAPDGSLWSSGIVSGELGQTVDGRLTVATTIEAGINGISVADDGTVYVATGSTLSRFTPGDAAAEVVASDLPDINGFGLLADGRIFAPGGGFLGPGKAVVIDPATGEWEVVVDDLPGVAAADIDPDGVPYLLSNVTGKLFRVDVEAGTAELVDTVTEGLPFDNLAFADDGTLYFSSFATASLTELATDGTVRTIPLGT